LLPDLSVFWVVFFVLLLTLILDRLFFRPLLAIIKQREDAVGSAKALADQAAAEARRATEEFDRQTASARAEVYRQMDEVPLWTIAPLWWTPRAKKLKQRWLRPALISRVTWPMPVRVSTRTPTHWRPMPRRKFSDVACPNATSYITQ
jgi:hypothetical protein